jgi:hypothetical protein
MPFSREVVQDDSSNTDSLSPSRAVQSAASSRSLQQVASLLPVQSPAAEGNPWPSLKQMDSTRVH